MDRTGTCIGLGIDGVDPMILLGHCARGGSPLSEILDGLCYDFGLCVELDVGFCVDRGHDGWVWKRCLDGGIGIEAVPESEFRECLYSAGNALRQAKSHCGAGDRSFLNGDIPSVDL